VPISLSAERKVDPGPTAYGFGKVRDLIKEAVLEICFESRGGLHGRSQGAIWGPASSTSAPTKKRDGGRWCHNLRSF